MYNYLYEIKMNPVGYGAGSIVTSRKLGICRLGGGIVSLSFKTPTGAIETFDLSQASGLTFDTATPAEAGLDGFFQGKYSLLSFNRLGTYQRVFTARNSPFGRFGRRAAGWSITWQPAYGQGIGVPIDPTKPGTTLPM